MRCFRANRRFGSWCALVALMIQLALSFGHLHRDLIAFSFGSATHLAGWAGEAPAALPDDPASPSRPGVPAFDYCAVCAVINLAGASMPAASPALPLPPAVGWIPASL